MWDLVGLIAYRFLLILCSFLVYFFPVQSNRKKSIIKILFNLEVNFSLFNTEETKSLIIPIHYMQKANVHDTIRNFQKKRKQGKVRLR